MPNQEDVSRNGCNHGGDILELALDRIGRRISAVTSSTPVDTVEGKMPSEFWSDGIPVRMVDSRAVNEHKRGAFSASRLRDPGAVVRNHVFHVPSFLPSQTDPSGPIHRLSPPCCDRSPCCLQPS